MQRGDHGRDHGQAGARLVDLVEDLADVKDGGHQRKARKGQRDRDAVREPEGHRERQRHPDRGDHQAGRLDVDSEYLLAVLLASKLGGALPVVRCAARLGSGLAMARLALDWRLSLRFGRGGCLGMSMFGGGLAARLSGMLIRREDEAASERGVRLA